MQKITVQMLHYGHNIALNSLSLLCITILPKTLSGTETIQILTLWGFLFILGTIKMNVMQLLVQIVLTQHITYFIRYPLGNLGSII